MPNSLERDALFRQAKVLTVAYIPCKLFLHRIRNTVNYAYVIGHRRPLCWAEWWYMVDIDRSAP